MTGTKCIASCVCMIWLCKYFESESDSCLFLYLYCECCWIITTTKTETTTIRSDLQRLSTGSVRQLSLSTLSSYTLSEYLRDSVQSHDALFVLSLVTCRAIDVQLCGQIFSYLVFLHIEPYNTYAIPELRIALALGFNVKFSSGSSWQSAKAFSQRFHCHTRTHSLAHT